LRDDTIVFISGSGTDSLAAAHGLEMVDNSYFTVPEKSTYWRNNVHAHALMKVEHHGTVGAVALDKEGNLAAANSTGGTMFKAVGRIGDTAINGAGIYADPSIAVVWCVELEPFYLTHQLTSWTAAEAERQF
jgi:beta-aspartyl-peptidase (threonine type)